MDERVAGADDAQTSGLDTMRVVVVFKHPHAECFVERSDQLERRSPHRDTKHREHVNVGDPAIMRSRTLAGKRLHLRPRAVSRVDKGFVARGVRHWSHQANVRIGERTNEPGEPALRYDRVVVEKYNDLAGSAPNALIVRRGKTHVRLVAYDADT